MPSQPTAQDNLRIGIMIEEGGYFSSLFFSDLVNQLRDQVKIVFILNRKSENISDQIGWNLLRNIRFIGVIALLKLIGTTIFRKCLSRFPIGLVGPQNASASKIAKRNGLTVISISDANSDFVRNTIKNYNLDVVCSSITQILKKKTLEVPRLGFLNRHASILPGYGGLLPLFQAISHGETVVGVSVHRINESVDKGEILCQKVIKIQPEESLWDISQRVYQLSGECVSQSIKVLTGNSEPILYTPAPQPSYHSLPSREDWQQFKERGIRFI
jgi:folate-dependent phosphoribosylglycinamide formyltransferase PurN